MVDETTIIMDEVTEDKYDAVYFCGVVKKGYSNKNPLKNNYPHNVHFAVIPCEGKLTYGNLKIGMLKLRMENCHIFLLKTNLTKSSL